MVVLITLFGYRMPLTRLKIPNMSCVDYLRESMAPTVLLCVMLSNGCYRNQDVIAPAPTPGPQVETPPVFELRDFALAKKGTQFSTLYWGRGSLVSIDPRLKEKNVAVLLKATVVGAETTEKTLSVLLKDGVGIVETSDYIGKEDAPAPQYTDWQISGYFELKPGQLEVK